MPTCQFAPASFSSSRSNIFSRTLPLLHLVGRGRSSTEQKAEHAPFKLRHTPLVLPLCPLQDQLQVCVLLLEGLHFV